MAGSGSHDLEPNRAYAEVTRIAGEFKRVGPQIANLAKANEVGNLRKAVGKVSRLR